LDADEIFLLTQKVDGIQEKIRVALQVEIAVAGEIAITKHQKLRLPPRVSGLRGPTGWLVLALWVIARLFC
jgi:hypothetical protein